MPRTSVRGFFNAHSEADKRMGGRERTAVDDGKKTAIKLGTPLHHILEMIAIAVANKLVGEGDSERKARRSKFQKKTRQDT